MRGRDEGLALVEVALVLPLLCLLAFGTVELGRAWVASNRVEGAASQAARMGAVSGGRVEADRDVLVALRAALPGEALSNVDRVVVFRSATADGTVPAGCVKPSGSTSEVGTADCNTYTGATLRATTATSMVGFGASPTAKDRHWAPSGRRDALADPPDYLGVWIRTKYQSVTGVGFVELTLTASSIHRIQPDLAG
jgi:Flp pilus assembly protein TadG